jgi:hypothetical protein
MKLRIEPTDREGDNYPVYRIIVEGLPETGQRFFTEPYGPVQDVLLERLSVGLGPRTKAQAECMAALEPRLFIRPLGEFGGKL